jgi:AcrR family transcriptional regulator
MRYDALVSDSIVAGHPRIAPLLSDRPQRARLLEAMVRAVADKGYEAATVADAVRLARVSRGTFYELFDSKEACLLAAYQLGYEVLEERIRTAIRDAKDWREELRLGIRAYLLTLEQDPVFARVYLVEAQVIWAEREAVCWRFASRYGRTFAKSGRPVPPPEALYVLATGVHELACARVRKGEPVLDLEETLVGCAVRLVTKEEEPWT